MNATKATSETEWGKEDLALRSRRTRQKRVMGQMMVKGAVRRRQCWWARCCLEVRRFPKSQPGGYQPIRCSYKDHPPTSSPPP